uniref:Uncharacterized protein n=1 Tax=Escherichia phage UFV-AREG1 TaxID=1837867 RepID=A0A173GAH3_9CAUD
MKNLISFGVKPWWAARWETVEPEPDLSEIIEDHDAFSENYDFDFSDYLKPVEIEDWVQDGKCQYRQCGLL